MAEPDGRPGDSLFGIPIVVIPGLPPDIAAIVVPDQDPVVFRLPDD